MLPRFYLVFCYDASNSAPPHLSKVHPVGRKTRPDWSGDRTSSRNGLEVLGHLVLRVCVRRKGAKHLSKTHDLDLQQLKLAVASGTMSRRDALKRAAALGLS